ncbi:MAG: response regulator [Halodesulfovibrio sp.]
MLEALALQDGNNVDLQGLWISCKGRMVFLADALRMPPDSGKGSMLRTGGADTLLMPLLALAIVGLVMLFVMLRVHVVHPLRLILKGEHREQHPAVFFTDISQLISAPSPKSGDAVHEGDGVMFDSPPTPAEWADGVEGVHRTNHETSVLLVEDSPLSAEVSRQVLHSAGVAVAVADSGYVALELAEHTVFRMVLIDLSMPGMDGCEVASRLKKLPRYRHVPLFALTADDVAAVAQECREAGMAGVLQKPLALPLVDILVQRMRGNIADATVRDSETALFFERTSSIADEVEGMKIAGTIESQQIATDRATASEPDSASLHGIVAEESVEAVLDARFALQEMGIGPEQLAAILREMNTLIPTYLNDLASLQTGGDNVALKALAHRIKGEGGNIGALQVRFLAAQLERAALEDSAEASVANMRLQSALKALAECIELGTWRA